MADAVSGLPARFSKYSNRSLAIFSCCLIVLISTELAPASNVESICALDKKPKIPILVITINITTADVKYDFNKKGQVFQLRYNHDAVTNLLISRTEPIKTIGQNAPVKIAAKPIME